MSTEERAFIKPGVMPDGTPMKARKPMGGFLAEQGEEVVLDSHWRRRLADGDVVEAERPVDDGSTVENERPAEDGAEGDQAAVDGDVVKAAAKKPKTAK